MSGKKDNLTEIPTKWAFDANVTEVFEDMLSRSIPNYRDMRDLCYRLGRHFLMGDSNRMVDLGCSNGLSSEPFVEFHKDNTEFFLFDVSEPMLKECASRFADVGNVRVVKHDLRDELPINNGSVDLVMSVLTIQFTPIEFRQNILSEVHRVLKEGGAFIFVEKVIGNSVKIDNLFVKEYYNIKGENGYTQSQIKDKRKSLEGVLVPLTASFNEHLLASTGFKYVDCFFRHLNFSAWIAVK